MWAEGIVACLEVVPPNAPEEIDRNYSETS
jgi:hypothetical protein